MNQYKTLKKREKYMMYVLPAIIAFVFIVAIYLGLNNNPATESENPVLNAYSPIFSVIPFMLWGLFISAAITVVWKAAYKVYVQEPLLNVKQNKHKTESP